jgi:GNAT superfamily N-acetyltransferase
MPTDTAAETPALIIAKFEKALHERSAFSCGHEPIDNFLKGSLSEQTKAGMIKAYIAVSEGSPDVLGFYTLGAMAVRGNLGPKRWGRMRVEDIPVIYLRAVAVRKDMQGRGLGTALMINAIKLCIGISDQMGAAAIVLDVLDVLEDEHFDRRQSFYTELGFASLADPDNPTRMFISMSDAKATLG